MTGHHDPEMELHGLKAHLANLREDLHEVVVNAGTTIRHYGHWDEDSAKQLVEEIDQRLGKAVSGLESRMEGASPEERRGYEEAVARLTALRADLDAHFGPIGGGEADHHTLHVIGEFHDRVDEHLAYLRGSGREW